MNSSHLNPDVLKEKLSAICEERNADSRFLLSNEGREQLQTLGNEIDKDFSLKLLIPWVKERTFEIAPMEVIWFLNKKNFIHVSTYIYFNPEFSLVINESLLEIIFDHNESPPSEIERKIVSDLLIHFINMWKPLERDVHPHCSEFLDDFISGVVQRVDSDCKLKLNFLSSIVESGTVFEPQLRLFTVYQIKKILSYESDSVSLYTAVSDQTKRWTMKTMPAGVKQMLMQIFVMLPEDVIVEKIHDAIISRTFSWKFLLMSISVFATHRSENPTLIKETLDSWLKEGFANKDKTLLSAVLLISRQCCAEGVRHFSNYASWFGSLQLKNATSFSFFYQFLSEIVPYEMALNLKIHVNKVPSAPPSCQSLLIDYLSLAKTRLSDLNETTEYIGLFNDCHESDLEGQEADIAKVITLYKENKEIPKAVFEAAVFRRQYFEKVFLSRLLSVPEKDDPIRAEVINKLHSLGKIPNSLMNTWNNLQNITE